MSGVSQKELILTHFKINSNFLLDLLKYLTEMNPKQRWSFEQVFFVEVMRERIILALSTQYTVTW